jgi:hypothetical protein
MSSNYSVYPHTLSDIITASAPPPPRYFIGRKREIEKVVKDVIAPKSNVMIVLLGMGGIGKTALAEQIAEDVKINFPGGIFWGEELPSKESNSAIILKKWGRLCGQNLDNENEENLSSLVRGLLIARKTQMGPILVIVDDVRVNWLGGGIKTIEDALPPDTPLIITTRHAQVAQEIDAKIYNLNVLPRAESCQLLKSLSEKKITGSNAQKIAELCGDMPLALELIARLAKTRKSEWLLERLKIESNRLDVLKLDQASRKEQSVNISIEISYQALIEQNPETALIFRYLSAFASPAFIIYRHLISSLAQSNLHNVSGQSTKGEILQPNPGENSLAAYKFSSDYENEVFVSYAWGGESEQTVNELEHTFAEHGIRIIRDKKELDYKGSIKEFEERIGMGQCIVLLISDKYLRSEHCMYELMEVEKNQHLRERIFPIVLTDADIYSSAGRLAYIKYWDKQIKRLNNSIKQIDLIADLDSITNNLKTYMRIRANIDHLTDLLSDMNTLTPEIHAKSGFSTLISSIELMLHKKQKKVPSIKPWNSVTLSQDQYAKSIEDNILRLVDWSLLQEDESIRENNMEYFRVHTLLHEYAQSVLVDAAETEDAIRNQILYCTTLAETNSQSNLQQQQKVTLELEKSYVQLLQALAQIKKHYLSKVKNWKDEPQLANQIIILVSCMENYWQGHSQFDEQIEWLRLAYSCANIQNHAVRQADFARRLGRVLSWQGKIDDALKWMQRAESDLNENISEDANAVRALIHIHSSAIYFQQDEIEPAEVNCLRGIELADPQKYPRAYAEGYNLLGGIKIQSGKLASALDAFEKSLSTWKQIGDQYQINRVEDNVRTALFYLGDIAHLRKAEDASLRHWEQFPYRIELAMALTNRGLVHVIDHEYNSAIELQKRAVELSDFLGVPRIQSMTRVNIASSYIAMGKYDVAEICLKQSMEIQSNHNIKEYWIDAKRSLAEIALGRELGSEAIELATEAETLARESDEPLELGTTLRTLGQAYHLVEDSEKALQCLESSLSYLRENGFKYESFLTLLAVVKVFEDLNNMEKVREIHKELQSLINEMGLSSGNLPSEQA